MLLMADHRSTEEYRLRWNSHTEAITETFSHLYQSKTIADVLLSTEGGIIKAHRVVLSVCSMYFRKLFTSIEESNPVIVLPNISYNHMQYLMQFMYLGEAQVKSEELKEVLNIAHILQIKGFSTDLNKSAFAHCDRDVSHRQLTGGFGMVPPMSHPILSPAPPMMPPGLVINPSFGLTNSIPLHNLVSLSRNMVCPSLGAAFGHPNNARSLPQTSPLMFQSKKCIGSRKRLVRGVPRLNGSVKPSRFFPDRPKSQCVNKSDSSPLLVASALASENEPTDLSMSTPSFPSPPTSCEISVCKPKLETEDIAKEAIPPVAHSKNSIDILDLSPKASPDSVIELQSKVPLKRKSCDSSESDCSSQSHPDSDGDAASSCAYKKTTHLKDNPDDLEVDQDKTDDYSSDTLPGPSWDMSRSRINGVPTKYEKQDDFEDDDSLQALGENREEFWKNQMKDGLLNPYLSGAVPQLPMDSRPPNFDSTITSLYSNSGGPSSTWNSAGVSSPSASADIPFHLRLNECTKCGRLYKTRKGLKHHIKNECGVEPRFQCTHCDWRFKQKAHLLRHMARKHTL